MTELKETLVALAGKAKRLLATDGSVGEENTKAVLVEPMLQALGWDTHDLDEVQREYRYRSQDNPVDYALIVSTHPRLFVEAKSLGNDLGQHKWRTQAVNYANTSGVEWCVLTDGNFWQVYKSNAPGDLEQKLFLETWLYDPKGRLAPYEPQYVLSLLAREKLQENEIETLWQILNADRKGREAFLAMIAAKDSSLLRLIKKRSGLTQKQIEAFFSRAEITVETPPVVSRPSPSLPPKKPQEGVVKKRSRSKQSQTSGLPTQRQLEVPLLQAILQRGGLVDVRSQGHDIDNELADQFGLTSEQRTATFINRPERIWSNRIRWTRMRLVLTEDIDGSQRGIWRLTEQGRKRAEQG